MALVGVGLLSVGAGTVLVLALAARAIPGDGFAVLVTWWSATSLVALMFSVVESYLPRVLIGSGALDPDKDSAVRAWFTRASALVLTGIAVAGVVLAPLLIPAVFASGELLALAYAYILIAALQSLQRGIAIGRSRFGAITVQMVTDGVLRAALGWMVLVLGLDRPEAYALAMTFAAAAGVLAASPTVRPWLALRGARASVRMLPMAMLFVATVGPQVVNNLPVPWIAATQEVDPYALGAFAGAMTLSRVPTLLVGAAYGPVLSPLSIAVARRDRAGFRRVYRWGSLGATAFGVVFVLAFAGLGGWLISVYLGPGYAVSEAVLVLLAAASALLFVSVVQQAALVALEAFPVVALGWALGVAVFGLVLLLPLAPFDRAALACVAACVTAVAVMAATVPSRVVALNAS